MEMHLPAYNFTQEAGPAKLPSFALHRDVVLTTPDLMVYATPADFTLRALCTLDELRYVSGVLSAMFIGMCLSEIERQGESPWNSGYLAYNFLEPGMTGQRMFRLVEQDTSSQIHLASLMAFYERLPYHPKVRGSRPQADALARLAELGARVRVRNQVSFKGPDHHHLIAALHGSRSAMAMAGFTLNHTTAELLSRVVAGLDVPAIIALDKTRLSLY